MFCFSSTIKDHTDIIWNEFRQSICTCDIDLQSVADKMVWEIYLEVRENSGKSLGTFFQMFGGNPVYSF